MRQLLFALTFIFAFGSANALAQTTLVVDDEIGIDNGTSPFATVQAAINAATTGDIISITGGTDNLHTEQNINLIKGITIKGQGQNTTILQAHAQRNKATSRIFNISTTTNPVYFQDLMLRHGKAVSGSIGGAVNILKTPTTFERVTLTQNNSFYGGGSIAISFNTELTLTDCILEDNQAGAYGGAILSRSGNVTAANCLFRDNVAAWGGGGLGCFRSANFDINRCTFTGNSSPLGGAIIIQNGTYNISNSTIYGNTATNYGGGIYDGRTSNTCNITNSTIVENTASNFYGGGIYFQNTTGKDQLTNTIVANNTDKNGANDLYFNYGTLHANESNLVENCESSTNGTCPTFYSSNDPNLTVVASCGKHSYFKPQNPSAALDNGMAVGDMVEDICGRVRTAPHDLGSFDVNAKVFPEISGNTPFCHGHSIELDAGNWASFEWSNGATTPTLEIHTGGNYAVTVTDFYGATGTENIEVEAFDIFTFDTDNASQSQTATGTNIYSVDVCGGTLPFSIEVDTEGGFVNTQFSASTTLGCRMLQITYANGVDWTATVTDANGCTNEVTALIGDDPILVIEGFDATKESGAGKNDGALTINISGGDDNCDDYTYNWSGSNLNLNNTGSTTGNTITGLSMGNYSVTVTDCSNNTIVGSHYINRSSGRARGRSKTTLDASIDTQLKLYPNPATDFVGIAYHTRPTSATTTLSITDLAGKNLWTQIVSEEEGLLNIPIRNLKNGLYIVTIKTDNELIGKEKLLIMR